MKKNGERRKEFPQQSDLVQRHMQSHHRRVTHAKGRVDAAPPKALCCTKMMDRAEREQQRKSPSGMTTTKEKSLHVAGGNFTVGNGPPATTLPLLDSCSLEGEGGGGRWHLYHTHTGRLTGFLRERQRLSRRGQDKRHLQPPWRPPYTSAASCSPLAGAIGTKHQGKSSTHRSSSKMCDKTAGVTGLDVQETEVKSDDSNVQSDNSDGNPDVRSEVETEESCSSYSSWTDVSEDNEDDERTVLVDDDAQQITKKNHSAREILLQGEEMKQKTFALTERNTKTKQECQERELESRYLEFVSEVTQEIVRRRVLTRPALDLLCQTHIHRHRHLLREDEMVKRLDELKKQIGVT